MDEHAGQSGADIKLQSTAVLKTAESGPVLDRLMAQYEFLADHHGCEGIVQVIQRESDGYTMERLQELPHHIISPARLAHHIERILLTDVWPDVSSATVVHDEFDWSHHWEYVKDRGQFLTDRQMYALQVWFTSTRNAVAEGKLLSHEIHGDPTFSNAMLRNGELVLIDPIPWSDTIPPLRAVDRGKILQSLCGYEQRRFGWKLPLHATFTDGCVYGELNLGYENHQEQAAAEYFAIVHYLRLIPYTSNDTVAVFQEFVKEVLDARRL